VIGDTHVRVDSCSRLPILPGSGGTVGLVIDGVAGAIAVVVGTVD
jgi:hypothetical protein